MMKKYNDFINDKIYESIDNMFSLLESNVYFSKKFRRVLQSIDAPIAKTLLSIENNDLPVAANYFDVDTKKNDYLFFTPDKKAVDIIKESREVVNFIGGDSGWLKHSEGNKSIFEKLGYTPGELYIPSPTDIGVIESQVISSISGKTFCKVVFDNGKEGAFNKNRLSIFNESDVKVWNSNRQNVKIGRSMNALLNIAKKNGIQSNYNASDVEKFVNLYKVKVDILNEIYSDFEVVTGQEIAYWYDDKNYYERNGTLGSSCMSNVDKSFFELYTTSENISLVILKSKQDDSKIIGRALLWKLKNDITFMDRIYAINDSDIQLFKQYAKDSGWGSKHNNNSSDTGNVDMPNGETILTELTCDVEEDIDKYPYLDTLKYYYREKGIISNSEKHGHYYTLESTGGGHSDSDEDECEYCLGGMEVECYNCDGEGNVDCGSCSGKGSGYCETCDGEGTLEDENGESKECSDCNGSGNVDCEDCNGRGTRECSRCEGEGTTECYECN